MPLFLPEILGFQSANVIRGAWILLKQIVNDKGPHGRPLSILSKPPDDGECGDRSKDCKRGS